MNKQIAVLIFSVLVAFSLAGCGDGLTENVKIIVLGYGSNFVVTYIADGDLVTPSSTGSSIGNNTYLFEKTITITDQLEIDATPNDSSGDSIVIKVYRDNSKVKSVEDSTSPIEKIALVYESGESASSQ